MESGPESEYVMRNGPDDDDAGMPADGWTWRDVGHGVLDVAGLVPVIGEGADLVNAAWHATEGSYLEAGLSIVSMIPVVGDAVGKGGKLAKKGAGELAGPALDALRKVDFAKLLAPLAKHPRIGPHVDEIVRSLENWRTSVTSAMNDVTPAGMQRCPKSGKTSGKAPVTGAATIGKTLVPARILEKLSPEQLRVFSSAIERVENMRPPRKNRAVFYSGKVGRTYAYKAAEDAAKAGRWDSVNTLTSNLLNSDIRKVLPPDAVSFIDNLASGNLARSASGDVKFFGEVDTISATSVFRNIELPALLSNTKISQAARTDLLNMKYFLDAKYGR